MNQFKEDEYYIKKLYGAYQLDWMMSHGYSLQDLMKELNNVSDYHDEHIHDGYTGDGMPTGEFFVDVDGIFHDWEYDRGFGSEIWVCYDEFCGAELQDNAYIQGLVDRMGLITNEDRHEFRMWYAQYMAEE